MKDVEESSESKRVIQSYSYVPKLSSKAARKWQNADT